MFCFVFFGVVFERYRVFCFSFFLGGMNKNFLNWFLLFFQLLRSVGEVFSLTIFYCMQHFNKFCGCSLISYFYYMAHINMF